MSDTIVKVNKTIDDLQDDVKRAVVSIGDTAGNANALIIAVSEDVKKMASAGNRISSDAAEITDSIIFPGVRIGPGARLHRCVIDKNVVIPAGQQIGMDAERDRAQFSMSDAGIVIVPKEHLVVEPVS